jgi:hypothetical protein
MVHSLTRAPREVIRPVQETVIELFQQIARTDSKMLEYSIVKIRETERSTSDVALEGVMIAIVDRYVLLTYAMGPAIGSPQPEKKKVHKSATANPAFKDGVAIQCQICSNEHSAKDGLAFTEKTKRMQSNEESYFLAKLSRAESDAQLSKHRGVRRKVLFGLCEAEMLPTIGSSNELTRHKIAGN